MAGKPTVGDLVRAMVVEMADTKQMRFRMAHDDKTVAQVTGVLLVLCAELCRDLAARDGLTVDEVMRANLELLWPTKPRRQVRKIVRDPDRVSA
ncbi:MAG: hypothetical protein ABIU95_01855 [Burkholderiales bacterium]